MLEMDAQSKPPQISEMFQKFATAFKAKTFEFFADDGGGDDDPAASDSDGFCLLDSAEEFITNQKVVVIKPDSGLKPAPPPSPFSPAPLPCFPSAPLSTAPEAPHCSQPPPPPPSLHKAHTQKAPADTQITETLISSLFATISSFKASYIQLQAAHAPFDEEGIKAADRAIFSHLQKLSGLKRLCRNSSASSDFDLDFAIGSCLESLVQENQSMLRALEIIVNRSQSEIDSKDAEVLALRKNLDKVQRSNLALSKKLNGNLVNSSAQVLLTVSVFNSVLRDTCRSVYRFTKLLITLMKKAGWDLELAAKSVHSGIDYAKKGHYRYALLSYVCLGMFQGFNSEGFGLNVSEILCNGDNDSNSCEKVSLKQLLEHVSVGPMEALSRSSNCEFSKFCEKKYQQIIHPTMESSIFSNLDVSEVVSSWRSLSFFYEAFVDMASSIWVLHKLAFSFDPAVEIFQVERGVEFSVVYMEDATRRCIMSGKSRPKVAFTIVPGFRIGKTVIQSQVYLTGLKCTEV